MTVNPKQSFRTSGWASYTTFDADLDPNSVQDGNAKYSAHGKEYAANLKLVAPNKVRASPAEEIDAGEFYVQLDKLKYKGGARISNRAMKFGPGSASRT